jgi:hypothetical protein
MTSEEDHQILSSLGVGSEVDSDALKMEQYNKHPELHDIHGIDPYYAYLAHAIVWIAAAAGGGAIGNGTYEAAKLAIKALRDRRKRDPNARLNKNEAFDFAQYAIKIYQYSVFNHPPVCFEFEQVSARIKSEEWTVALKRTVRDGSGTNPGGFVEIRFNARQPGLTETFILDEHPIDSSHGNPQWVRMPNYRWRPSRTDIEWYATVAAITHYARSRRKYSFEVVKSIRRMDTWYVTLQRLRRQGAKVELDGIVKVKMPTDIDMISDARMKIKDGSSAWSSINEL